MVNILKDDVRARSIEILDLAERTTSGESDSIDVHQWREVILYLNVTAASGTSPTLDVKILSSPDGETWYELDTFPQMTGVGMQVKQLEKFGWYLKIAYEISGSFTFGVKATFKRVR